MALGGRAGGVGEAEGCCGCRFAPCIVCCLHCFHHTCPAAPQHCCAPVRRDRRYEYKGLTKVWKGKLDDAKVGLCTRFSIA